MQGDWPIKLQHCNNCNSVLLFLLIHIQRRALRKRDAVGTVEGFQVDLIVTDAQPDRHDCPQQLSVLTRIEAGRWQFVPPLLLTPVAHFPDKIIVSFMAEPRFQHIPDAEALILTSEEAPRALQPKPELHKAFLIVLKFHIKIGID